MSLLPPEGSMRREVLAVFATIVALGLGVGAVLGSTVAVASLLPTGSWEQVVVSTAFIVGVLGGIAYGAAWYEDRH